MLGTAGVAATLDVLRGFAAAIRLHDAEVFAVGTEALRRAPNAADFLAAARAILGTEVEVIDGEREAELTFRAVVESFPGEVERGRCVVLDIGGGSTEIVESLDGHVVARTSLPLGSVRLTERYVKHDPPTDAEAAHIRAGLAESLRASGLDARFRVQQMAATATAPPSPVTLVGVAGTVTSLAAMAMGLATYDPDRVHGSLLSLSDLEAQISRLAAADQRGRETIVGLDPKRADVIFAGSLLLHELATRIGANAIRVSDRGIRWGLFYERAAHRLRPT